MKLLQLDCDFVACKLTSFETVNLSQNFSFLSITDDEISLVCDR